MHWDAALRVLQILKVLIDRVFFLDLILIYIYGIIVIQIGLIIP